MSKKTKNAKGTATIIVSDGKDGHAHVSAEFDPPIEGLENATYAQKVAIRMCQAAERLGKNGAENLVVE